MHSRTNARLGARLTLLAAVFMVLMAFGSAQAAVVFVDSRASICGNGQSWTTAHKYLQDALTAARNSGGTITEIHVAVGTYQPDRDCVNPTGSLSRTATFQLINNVDFRGGYAGIGAPDPDARDIVAYKTILSGDLAGDDGSNFANNGENAYHVATGSGTTATAILDGFTISDGNANGSSSPDNNGGGMYNSSGSPTVTSCTFSGNSAALGGGMFNFTGAPMLTNCAFVGNSSGGAGGVCVVGGSPVTANCTFRGNTTFSSGGGMTILYDSSPTIMNCLFSENHTGGVKGYGGGIYSYGYNNLGPTLIVTNCVFHKNSADQVGGGILLYRNTSARLTNCSFRAYLTRLWHRFSTGAAQVGNLCHRAYRDRLLARTRLMMAAG